MRKLFISSCLSAIAAVGMSAAAGATTLASADNPQIGDYSGPSFIETYGLTPANLMALNFQTTQPNETVQLSLSALCGILQTVGAPSGQSTSASAGVVFEVDGQPIYSSGNWGNFFTLCATSLYSQTPYYSPSSSLVQVSTVIPRPGMHLVSVQLQMQTSGGWLTFGQTHLSVTD
ncbi:MAG TPA: hypothetical protein VEK34_01450 [Methylocella sp.]|nr:hypothetical protein [Methylocella sp.]